MNIFESLRVAMRGLASNLMRTGLTMLGIIIGVGVVILVVAIGQGASQKVTEAVNSLGTNMLSIWPGTSRIKISAVSTSTINNTPTTGAGSTATAQVQSTNRLTLDDAKNIAKNFPKTVEAVAPQVRDNVQIRLGNKDSTTNLTGTTVDYPFVNNMEVNKGRFFTQSEVDGSQKVCVIGTTVADKLTGDSGTDLTGQKISVNRQEFLVVGIMAGKGAGAFGQDQDDLVLAPITTAMRRVLNRRYISFMGVRCVNPKMMPLAQEQISSYLRNR
ncbi:MAG: ABC transporter permease, partial [Armatimonadota bacterium]